MSLSALLSFPPSSQHPSPRSPSLEPAYPDWANILELHSGYPELSRPCHNEKLACTVLSFWACLIFSVHAVEGVVKEVVEHAKEAGEKGMVRWWGGVGVGGGTGKGRKEARC